MAARFNASRDAPWKLREMYTYACLEVASRFEVPVVLYGSTAINLYIARPEHEFTAADIDLFMVLDTASDFATWLARFRQRVDELLASMCSTSDHPPRLVTVGGKWMPAAAAVTAKLFMNDAVLAASPTTHIGDITLQLSAALRPLESVFPRKRTTLVSSYAPADRATPASTLRVASLHELLHRMSATVAGGSTLDGIECSPHTNGWRIEKDSARLDRLMDLSAAGHLTREPRSLVLAERGVSRAYTRRTAVAQASVGRACGVWMPCAPSPPVAAPPSLPIVSPPPPLVNTASLHANLASARSSLVELRAQLADLRVLASQHIEQGSSLASTCIMHVSNVRCSQCNSRHARCLDFLPFRIYLSFLET
jgi:hypothetical protein